MNTDRMMLESGLAQVQRMTASGAPLASTLDSLVRLVEQLSSAGVTASILVLDDERKRLRHGAGPSLPSEYNAAIDGIEIGPNVGSCGTAAYTNETVSVFDISTSALWANFKDLALSHGLRACWSTPIRGEDGKVVGTFANYYRVVRDPSPADRELTDAITHAAAAAIDAERRRRLARAG